MAVTTIGRPFQGTAWYWVEDSFGGGESTTTLDIGLYVQNVAIGSGDKSNDIRSIESAVIANRMELADDPTLSIEYNPQCDDNLIDDVIDRDSCCVLSSLAFCFGANTCTGSGNDDVTYYLVKGAKPSTVRISASKNEPYTVSVDFECKSVTTSTSATGTEPTRLSGDILHFNTAGSITKSGGFNPTGSKVAYVTNSIDITVDHQLTGYTDQGDSTKSYIVEGTMDVSGSVDITLDGGGGMHFGEVKDMTDFTLTIAMGGSGCPELSLVDCNWDNSEIPINTSGEAMMESASFTAVPSNCSSVVGTTA